jgi:phage regulator Rha-like protein
LVKEWFLTGASGKPRADSRDIAARFDKRHADMLRAIDELVSQLETTQRNFAFSEYRDSTGRTLRCISMDRDGRQAIERLDQNRKYQSIFFMAQRS